MPAVTLGIAATIILTGTLDAELDRWADHYGIDPELVRAVLWTESYGDPNAVGPCGERGPMQIMTATAETISHSTGIPAFLILSDPAANVRAGTWYLAWLLRWFDGDVDLALASYNAGPGWVLDCGCVPVFARHYVEKVRGLYPYRDYSPRLSLEWGRLRPI